MKAYSLKSKMRMELFILYLMRYLFNCMHSYYVYALHDNFVLL